MAISSSHFAAINGVSSSKAKTAKARPAPKAKTATTSSHFKSLTKKASSSKNSTRTTSAPAASKPKTPTSSKAKTATTSSHFKSLTTKTSSSKKSTHTAAAPSKPTVTSTPPKSIKPAKTKNAKAATAAGSTHVKSLVSQGNSTKPSQASNSTSSSKTSKPSQLHDSSVVAREAGRGVKGGDTVKQTETSVFNGQFKVPPQKPGTGPDRFIPKIPGDMPPEDNAKQNKQPGEEDKEQAATGQPVRETENAKKGMLPNLYRFIAPFNLPAKNRGPGLQNGSIVARDAQTGNAGVSGNGKAPESKETAKGPGGSGVGEPEKPNTKEGNRLTALNETPQANSPDKSVVFRDGGGDNTSPALPSLSAIIDQPTQKGDPKNPDIKEGNRLAALNETPPAYENAKEGVRLKALNDGGVAANSKDVVYTPWDATGNNMPDTIRVGSAQTFEDIATKYGMSEKELLDINPQLKTTKYPGGHEDPIIEEGTKINLRPERWSSPADSAESPGGSGVGDPASRYKSADFSYTPWDATSNIMPGGIEARQGQTFAAIAEEYGIDEEELIKLNPQLNVINVAGDYETAVIREGDTVILRQGYYTRDDLYEVKPGDTLEDIKKNTGLTEAQIMEFNPGIKISRHTEKLSSSEHSTIIEYEVVRDNIKPGQVIKLESSNFNLAASGLEGSTNDPHLMDADAVIITALRHQADANGDGEVSSSEAQNFTKSVESRQIGFGDSDMILDRVQQRAAIEMALDSTLLGKKERALYEKALEGFEPVQALVGNEGSFRPAKDSAKTYVNGITPLTANSLAGHQFSYGIDKAQSTTVKLYSADLHTHKTENVDNFAMNNGTGKLHGWAAASVSTSLSRPIALENRTIRSFATTFEGVYQPELSLNFGKDRAILGKGFVTDKFGVVSSVEITTEENRLEEISKGKIEMPNIHDLDTMRTGDMITLTTGVVTGGGVEGRLLHPRAQVGVVASYDGSTIRNAERHVFKMLEPDENGNRQIMILDGNSNKRSGSFTAGAILNPENGYLALRTSVTDIQLDNEFNFVVVNADSPEGAQILQGVLDGQSLNTAQLGQKIEGTLAHGSLTFEQAINVNSLSLKGYAENEGRRIQSLEGSQIAITRSVETSADITHDRNITIRNIDPSVNDGKSTTAAASQQLSLGTDQIASGNGQMGSARGYTRVVIDKWLNMSTGETTEDYQLSDPSSDKNDVVSLLESEVTGKPVVNKIIVQTPEGEKTGREAIDYLEKAKDPHSKVKFWFDRPQQVSGASIKFEDKQAVEEFVEFTQAAVKAEVDYQRVDQSNAGNSNWGMQDLAAETYTPEVLERYETVNTKGIVGINPAADGLDKFANSGEGLSGDAKLRQQLHDMTHFELADLLLEYEQYREERGIKDPLPVELVVRVDY